MSKKIITISREYGSGGNVVGQLLANKLGVPYYDNELLLLAHDRSAIQLQTIKEYDEKKGNRYFFYEVNHEGNNTVKKGLSMQDTVYEIQKDAILSIAETHTGAVIVGRCADIILKNAGYDPLTVFISAPFEARVERIRLLEETDVATTKKHVHKMDKERQAYYEIHTDQLWGHPASYDLVYDSSKFDDYSAIADAIAEFC